MSEEASYYLRFISFFIDVGTETALQVVNYCTKEDVESHLSSSETRKILQQLLKKKVLTKTQYNLATAPVPNPNYFDISLLITLLCNSVLLPAPNQGWENRPSQRDLSLSADILRLRNIRNSVVAHRSRAALTKYKFDRLWKELEEILLRITAITAPGKEEELINKIEYYRSRKQDAQNDQKYLQKLEEWWENCEDVSKLQVKVEELVQKCNEFVLFFRDRPEEYLCYERLLFEGGRLVLSNFLIKQISEQGHDLREILLKNRDFLEHLNKEMPKPLFHTDSTDTVLVNTDTDSWDIFVLADVIETTLKPKVMKVINIIKDARFNYAETALMSMHNQRCFSVCCGRLVYAIQTLSSSLDEDIQEKCDELIHSYSTMSPTDASIDYLGQLKSNGLEIKKLSDLYKETLEKLKKSMNEMEDAGLCFKNDHVFDLKMITLGENAEKKKVAEDTLETVWQAALKMSENPDEFGAVRLVVDRILEDVRNIPGVKADDIRRGCLLFSLRCCSCLNLVQIIDYLSSERFDEHMDNLSRELGYISDAVIRIEGRITFESLHTILENPQNCSKVEDKGLNLPIICTSPEGMRDVFKLLGDEKTRNNIDQISDGLSSQAGETISVKLLPDLKGFTGVFDDTDIAVSGLFSSSEKLDHSCDPCLTIDQLKLYVAFQELSITTTLVTPSKKLDRLIHKEDINIKTKSDKSTCFITACAVLSSNKLVLADHYNHKLKVVDTQSKRVVEQKKLGSSPGDITTLPQDQIAVTIPDKWMILIMTTGSKLSTVHIIPVEGECRGITYHQDHLYALCCNDPNNVVILDTKGYVYNTISLNNDILKDLWYIAVSEDSKLIHISNYSNECIVSITLQGEVSAVCKDLPGPLGMSMLADGSLLVCCGDDDTIHQISGDLKQVQEMIDGQQKPWSICYNHHQHEVYIGGWWCDQLSVFSVK